MNRTTFLFLALLIASCIITVNSRHETRTVITEKSVLTERVNTLQETIRRLELDKARMAAKATDDDEESDAAAATVACAPAAATEKAPAADKAAAPAKAAPAKA